MSIAVYAGSFDPPTLAHIDIIERANKTFDQLIIGVGINSSKNPLFTQQRRITLLKAALSHKVAVEPFNGLLVDFCKTHGATVIVRGLRAISDFESEMAIAHTNYDLAQLETLFLPTRPSLSYVSSSMVKEIARQDSDTGWDSLDHYVSRPVLEALMEKYAHPQEI